MYAPVFESLSFLKVDVPASPMGRNRGRKGITLQPQQGAIDDRSKAVPAGTEQPLPPLSQAESLPGIHAPRHLIFTYNALNAVVLKLRPAIIFYIWPRRVDNSYPISQIPTPVMNLGPGSESSRQAGSIGA